MDLGLRIIDVAAILGVSKWTMILWEGQRTVPRVRAIPEIIRFLGYDPFPIGPSLPERLRAARRKLGLSQAALAKRLGVDEGTVRDWESSTPRRRSRRTAEALRKFLRASE
jgi:DNA-binding transcriptional regulator YiaG